MSNTPQRREGRTPPHSNSAELGVLGCCLLDGACVGKAVEFFRGNQVFYDLRHAEIFDALRELVAEVAVADAGLLAEALRKRGKLDEVGGMMFLATLPDGVPSAGNLQFYLDEVWEVFQKRQILKAATAGAIDVYAGQRDSGTILAEIEASVEAIKRVRGLVAGTRPERLKDLGEYEEEYYDLWFGAQKGIPGLPLPFMFPLKVRRGETTFCIAEKGAGKSTLLSYILLNLMQHGEKACIASMEQKPGISIKMMSTQLLGKATLPDTDEGHQEAIQAFDWLRSRLLIYDFLGIAEWREIMNAFDFAAKAGFSQFLIDSIMRLGIDDDDYKEQGRASKALSNWSQKSNSHLWIINHLNKSDRSTKQRSRGSQQWIDNSHNVVSIHRNEEKGDEIEKLKAQRVVDEITEEQFKESLKKLDTKYDTYFQLHNQRWQGSRQNGSRYLFWQGDSLQVSEEPFKAPVNWLERWRPRPERPAQEELAGTD